MENRNGVAFPLNLEGLREYSRDVRVYQRASYFQQAGRWVTLMMQGDDLKLTAAADVAASLQHRVVDWTTWCYKGERHR